MHIFIFKKTIMRQLLKISKKSFLTGAQKLSLPKLDYDYGDLEPIFSKEQLELHHSRHHQKYVDDYNKLVDVMQDSLSKGELEMVTHLSKELKFNGGSHINHSIYWKNLCPVKST